MSKWTDWKSIDELDGAAFNEIRYEKKYHIELGGGQARVTIDRPEKLNALTMTTCDEMFKAFYDADRDPSIGAVVITGAGNRAFCVGGDVVWETWGLRESLLWRRPMNHLTRICLKPIIAEVKGYAIGGGNHLAYCCDFTIAADNAVFGQNGPRVSSPADGYITPYLVWVVGAKKAKEMWMLCRRYTAEEALDMGLINEVAPLERIEERVDQWSEELLGMNPQSLRLLKYSFDHLMDLLPELGVQGNALYPDWFDSPLTQEGQQAFQEKRRPRFWPAREDEHTSKQ